jgi:two-component system NtrC family sensor kinase
VYPAQLNQVFMNIIVNAIDALEESVDNSHKSKISQIFIQTQKLDNSQILVRICDNGPGISPAIQSKLFDHFLQLKHQERALVLASRFATRLWKNIGGKSK